MPCPNTGKLLVSPSGKLNESQFWGMEVHRYCNTLHWLSIRGKQLFPGFKRRSFAKESFKVMLSDCSFTENSPAEAWRFARWWTAQHGQNH